MPEPHLDPCFIEHVSGGVVALFGNYAEQDMVAQMSELTGIALKNIDFVIFPIPASWVMEGGAVLPEPGEEASWLAQHHHAAE